MENALKRQGLGIDNTPNKEIDRSGKINSNEGQGNGQEPNSNNIYVYMGI